MGAAIRFMFQPGAPLGLFRVRGTASFRVPALSLREVMRDSRVAMFVGVWFGLYRDLYRDTSQGGTRAGQVPGAPGQRAWRGLLTAMLRSPRILFY